MHCRSAWLWGLSCLLFPALLTLFSSCAACADGLRVIVHPEAAAVGLDSSRVQGIFTLRDQQWPDGRPIHLVVLPDTAPLHQQFCREVLGVYPHQLRRIWDRRVFSGMAPAPRGVIDEAAMRREVAATPGAIGYLSREMSNEGVRVVPLP